MLSLQGFSATGPEVGTTVLPGLPGANPHRPACPESGLCNAGVHTVWVGINKDAPIHTHLYFRGNMYSVRIFGCNVLFFSSSGVRPFGVSLLIAGWDEDHPYLFQSDPSVCCINIFHIYNSSYISSCIILFIILCQKHNFLLDFNSSVSHWQGAYFAWKATAMGKNYVNGKTFLEKR